jgi:hypothetical protein
MTRQDAYFVFVTEHPLCIHARRARCPLPSTARPTEKKTRAGADGRRAAIRVGVDRSVVDCGVSTCLCATWRVNASVVASGHAMSGILLHAAVSRRERQSLIGE